MDTHQAVSHEMTWHMKERSPHPDMPLVFDLGFHRGEDTAYYLSRGCRVVAVEADPRLAARGRVAFSDAVRNGRLCLLHKAVVREGGKPTTFYVSPVSIWNSTHRDIAEREAPGAARAIHVPTVDLPQLMETYGVPDYCKIDIEGNDIEALSSLERTDSRPPFLSVESECLGREEDYGSRMSDTLDELHALGYTDFKLVDQRTLSVLDWRLFYDNTYPSPAHGYHDWLYAERLLGLRGEHAAFSLFFPGSSGPFGDDLLGGWLDYGEARGLLGFHHSSPFHRRLGRWHFWCDWHARLPHKKKNSP